MSANILKEEEVVRAIELQTRISREEIGKKIDETIMFFNGLLTRVGAALIIADKLNVRIGFTSNSMDEESDKLAIKDLIVGMKNINVAGRVQSVDAIKDFTRKKDGKPGKVGSMLISDETGSARVTLWNQQTSKLLTIHVGDIVGIYNAEVKPGYKSGIEINAGDKTSIKVNPEGIDASRFPSSAPTSTSVIPSKDVIPIASATEEMQFCTIKAAVTTKVGAKDFTRKDGMTGTLGKILVSDDSGSATIVFWSERMADYEQLVVGNTYQFSGIGIKLSKYSDELEFNVNKNTTITA